MADPKLKVFGKEYPLVVPEEFTLGESAEAERITGQGYDWDKPIGGLGLLALAYITVKRVDATVKVADLEMAKGDDLEVDVPEEEGDALPPAPSEGSSAKKKPSKRTGSGSSGLSQEPTPAATGTPV